MGETDNNTMANIMNDFFIDIGPNLAQDIPNSFLDMNLTFDNSREMFNFREVDEQEIGKLINAISSNKSTGVDGIPIKFIKLTS